MGVMILATVCYCLGFPVGASHLRASMRNVRKDPDSVLICIDTTRRNGPQTLIVQGQKEERDLVFQLIGESAALGACDPVKHRVAPLTTNQKKMVEVCLQSGGERMTARLPRVTRREFNKLGATYGPCNSPTSRIEIKLAKDVSVSDSAADLSGQWTAEKIRLGASLEPPLEGSPITITFDESRVHGSAGCNRIFGGTLIKSKLGGSNQIYHLVEISGLASTRMMCHPASKMRQEYAFIKSMSHKTFSFKTKSSGNKLEFYETEDLDGEVTEGELFAVFERIGDV